MGKEEIARYEQFLLFPQCFQKLPVVDLSWNKGLNTIGPSSLFISIPYQHLTSSVSKVVIILKYCPSHDNKHGDTDVNQSATGPTAIVMSNLWQRNSHDIVRQS